jgi:hypothetical protein
MKKLITLLLLSITNFVNAQIFDNKIDIKNVSDEYVQVTFNICSHVKSMETKIYLCGTWGKDSIDYAYEKSSNNADISKKGLRKLESNMIELMAKHQLKDSTNTPITCTEIALFNAMGKAGFEMFKSDKPLPMTMILDYGFAITVYTFKRKKV